MQWITSFARRRMRPNAYHRGMISPSRGRRVNIPFSPLEVLARWPQSEPVVMLHSGRRHERWGRWTVISRPEAWLRCAPHPEWLGPPGEITAALDPAMSLLGALDAALSVTDSAAALNPGGWMGYLAYDLGRVIEPAAQHAEPRRARDDRAWPLYEFARCPAVLVHDHASQQWHAQGDAAAAQNLLALALHDPAPLSPPCIGELSSATAPDEYLASVQRILDDIAAGDIFQANLTQRLSAPFRGSTRALAAAALAIAQPHYGAYLEVPGGRTLISMSPELFLELDSATRTVITRPIKGTRPISVDRADLERSEKDAAELHMITDLMRNDLGRVCEFGSVRVAVPRAIETHPTVHHGVSEIHGRLRPGATIGHLLQATFPCGSVTGAPKIRAMQIIDEIEPVRRGPYCGSIGWLGDDGAMTMNVAIRTICLTGRRDGSRWDALDGVLEYGAGGGIVADSRPLAEYRESHDKAAVLRQVLDAARREPVDHADLRSGSSP